MGVGTSIDPTYFLGEGVLRRKYKVLGNFIYLLNAFDAQRKGLFLVVEVQGRKTVCECPILSLNLSL